MNCPYCQAPIPPEVLASERFECTNHKIHPVFWFEHKDICLIIYIWNRPSSQYHVSIYPKEKVTVISTYTPKPNLIVRLRYVLDVTPENVEEHIGRVLKLKAFL